MNMAESYARDERGKIKHKQPCQTPGCNHPCWHVCMVGKPDISPAVIKKHGKGSTYRMSDYQREAIAEAQRARWAKVHAKTAERDEHVMSLYADDNYSIAKLQSEFDLGYHAVRQILRRGERLGKLKIRRKGRNLRFSDRITA